MLETHLSKKIPLIFTLVSITVGAVAQPVDLLTPDAKNPRHEPFFTQEADAVVERLVSQMTLEEKIKFCQGDIEGKSPPLRATAALERLGIKPMVFYNGPRGYQMGKGTVFPSPTGQAASWNPALLQKIGETIADESLSGKTDSLEAPSINIIRDPLNGRNFEYYTEDPYLNGKLAAAFVRGTQSAGAPATVKHLACNSQETNRNEVDSVVDERALREIYLPGFKAAIDEGVLGIMTGANRVNGHHASDNPDLIGIIKKDFGFRGFILTDWNGVQDTLGAANSGTDLSMPGKPEGKFSADKLLALVKSGQVSEATITDKVRRLLRAVYFAGLIEGAPARAVGEKPNPAHYQVELEAAEEGMVLLKNSKNLLPLNRTTPKKIAVLGPNADRKFWGGGSSGAGMIYEVTALAGIEKFLGKSKIDYVPLTLDNLYEAVDASFVKAPDGKPGFAAVYKGKNPTTGKPAELKQTVAAVNFNWEMSSPDRSTIDSGQFSGRWSGILSPPTSGKYTFRLSCPDTGKVIIDGATVVDKMASARDRSGEVTLTAGKPVNVEISFNKKGPQGSDTIVRFEWMRPDFDERFAEKLKSSVTAAKNADAAILCVGLDHSYDTEGQDRRELTLPPSQVQLIKAVVRANPRTVVVMYAGSVIDVRDWIDDVPALLLPWYPGIENGNALAKILFGEVSPAGKLTITFPAKYEDSPAHPSRQVENKRDKLMHHEGVFVGYRWFDEKGIAPMFPFGFGLSYTTFEYKAENRSLSNYVKGSKPLTIPVEIKNSGGRAGTETVQLYVHQDKPAIPRPPQELKGFQRVTLKPGETKTVNFALDDSAFAYWNPATRAWPVEPGVYEIRIGSSSRDIRLKLPMEVK